MLEHIVSLSLVFRQSLNSPASKLRSPAHPIGAALVDSIAPRQTLIERRLETWPFGESPHPDTVIGAGTSRAMKTVPSPPPDLQGRDAPGPCTRKQVTCDAAPTAAA